jgi:hypothetical protein
MTVVVNNTESPRQDGFADAAIDTANGSLGKTVITIVFDAAVSGDAQFRLEITSQFTRSPFSARY